MPALLPALGLILPVLGLTPLSVTESITDWASGVGGPGVGTQVVRPDNYAEEAPSPSQQYRSSGWKFRWQGPEEHLEYGQDIWSE